MAEITKMWIADKMREIMKRKPIDKIRVTEICKAADIERPTFYYHFKDKYDLVAWMFCTDAYGTDITSVTSAAAGMNRMKQEILFLSECTPALLVGVLCQALYETCKRKAGHRYSRYTACL